MGDHLVRWGRVLAIGVVVGLLVAPVAVRAGVSRFGDVDDASVFLSDIEWLADAGVTKGCNPPTNDMFCPGDNVTRQQMAAFMHRQARLFDGDDSGVVDNAETLDGYAPWDLTNAYALYDTTKWDDFNEYEWTAGLELEIDPPGSGLVYVTAVVEYFSIEASAHELSVMLCTDVSCAPFAWGPGALAGGIDSQQIVSTAVLPVDADGDVLRLWMRAPNGAVDVVGRHLTALYAPFGFIVDCDSGGCEVTEGL